MHQTRHDLEFMAGCLGIPAWREAVSTKRLICTKRLASAVAEGMADTVANDRARRRIAAMLFALPHMAATFVRDEYNRKAFVPPPDGQRTGPVRGNLESVARMAEGNVLTRERFTAMWNAHRRTAFPRMGATIRDEWHRRTGHVDAVTPPDNDPGPTPTRGDLEFMADCLGVKVIRGRWQGYPLEDEVDFKMADPCANARAQDRIADLLCELPIPYPDGAPPGYYGPVHAERLDPGHVLLS